MLNLITNYSENFVKFKQSLEKLILNVNLIKNEKYEKTEMYARVQKVKQLLDEISLKKKNHLLFQQSILKVVIK